MMVMKRPSCASSAGCWVVLFCSAPCSGFGWRCSSRRPRWRYARLAGIGMPDGFSVWHHLDANGIRFKSITPQKDGLLIKFDSTARARRRKKFSAALCHMVILLPCWRTITRPPPGYPACATRRIASGKLPPDCVFNPVWWFPAFVTMLKPAGINAFTFTTGNGYILRVSPQTMEGTIHETPHRSASGPDFT